MTSGGFGPTLGRPLAMGYVESSHSTVGTALDLMVRGKPVRAAIVPLPFVPKSFVRPQ